MFEDLPKNYIPSVTYFNSLKSSEQYSDWGNIMSPLRLESISVYKWNETVVFDLSEIIDILFYLTFEKENEWNYQADWGFDYQHPNWYIKKAVSIPVVSVKRTKQGVLKLQKGVHKNKNKFKSFRTWAKKQTKKKGWRR